MVDIRITGRNLKLTDGLEDYTRRKVERLDRYLPNIQDIHVDLSKQHNRRGEDMSIAQITVKHARGAILRSEEKTGGDIHIAVDNAVDKMYRRIVRFKGKKASKRRKANERFMATVEELDSAEPMPIEAVDATEAISNNGSDTDINEDVLRRKQVPLIPMDENEAIDQMELLGHSFFMFFNADTGQVNVVYRRADQGYGLLEPAN